jgi:hypothetical protein
MDAPDPRRSGCRALSVTGFGYDIGHTRRRAPLAGGSPPTSINIINIGIQRGFCIGFLLSGVP